MSGLANVNLVVIGHKDHGKSTLIGRLLYDSKAISELKLREIMEELKRTGRKEFEFAFILDSLEEERAGGLTIDIMQTPFKSEKYSYTIIDCPGHREFIRKMLTGASKADGAILVVSAKEGIEDQTRQHLFLARMLGIKQLVIAVNKMDLVGYSEEVFREVSDKIREVSRSLGYGDVPIVPVSAFQGDNVIKRSNRMRWYKGKTLIETLDSTVTPPKPPVEKPLRCSVQDIYEVEGERVIACKVETGVIKVGDEVLHMPPGDMGVVEKILTPLGEEQMAEPGESVGIVVKELRSVKRGDVISHPENPIKRVKEFTAELVVFLDTEIREDETVTIRVGTAERRCKVVKILEKIDPVSLTVEERSPESLLEGDVGKVLLKPLEPLCLEVYSEFPELGRFVIVGGRGAEAAGIILEKEDA